MEKKMRGRRPLLRPTGALLPAHFHCYLVLELDKYLKHFELNQHLRSTETKLDYFRDTSSEPS